MERLRYVARASGVDTLLLVEESAEALASLDDDRAAMVMACRRMVQRHPTCGPLWWLCSRLLTAADPRAEAQAALLQLTADETADALEVALPDDAVVCVPGWPEVAAGGLIARGDVRVLVVDCAGEGSGLVRALGRGDVPAEDVPVDGLGAAAADADLVLLEALAAGPDHVLAVSGSRAAATVARDAGKPVWLVCGAGRWLPRRVWEALLGRLDLTGEPWERHEEVLPLRLVDRVVGPTGLVDVERARRATDCPVAPELLR